MRFWVTWACPMISRSGGTQTLAFGQGPGKMRQAMRRGASSLVRQSGVQWSGGWPGVLGTPRAGFVQLGRLAQGQERYMTIGRRVCGWLLGALFAGIVSTAGSQAQNYPNR